jgi:cell division protein FtsI/penicillin-binding protein 2
MGADGMEATGERTRLAQGIIAGVCVVLVALVGRLGYIEAKLRPVLLEYSQKRQTSTIPLPGRRGSVMDSRHRVLAGSKDQPTIYADPRMITDHAEAAEQLAAVFNMPPAEVRKLLDDPTSPAYVVLKRGAEDVEVEGVRKLNLPGINVHREPVRNYPMGPLAAHVVGFVGSDGSGLEGVELSFEKYLRGTTGKRVVLCDAHRRALQEAPDSYVAPRDGLHVVLTIDAAIQEVVERELNKAVEHFQAQNGLAVLMSPKTGVIYAMACSPGYTPAKPGSATPDVRRNKVLTDPAEPGSIYKPFVMSAALAAGVTKPDDVIFCHNGLYVIGKRLLHDTHPYGNLTASEVVQHSSNIGMAVVGQRLGNRRMYLALRDMGFGSLTGIDLPGESVGLFMPYKAWNSYTTTSVPMGHEIAVTPIQLATAFSALVNGGRLIQPRVVSAVVDQEGEVVEDRSKVIDRGQVIEPTVAQMMREILVKTVNEGTGRAAGLDRWQVMGKTGTAQVPRADRRGYEPDAYLSSFCAAAPASDPAVTVLVMIRKPKKSIAYYGAQVSAPVVKAIMEETLQYLNIPPDKTPGLPNKESKVVSARP